LLSTKLNLFVFFVFLIVAELEAHIQMLSRNFELAQAALKKSQEQADDSQDLGSTLYRTVLPQSFSEVVRRSSQDLYKCRQQVECPDASGSDAKGGGPERHVQNAIQGWFQAASARSPVARSVVDTSKGTFPATFLPHDYQIDTCVFDDVSRHLAGLVFFIEYKIGLTHRKTYQEALGQGEKRLRLLSSSQPHRTSFFYVVADKEQIELVRADVDALSRRWAFARTGLLTLFDERNNQRPSIRSPGYAVIDWLSCSSDAALGYARFPSVHFCPRVPTGAFGLKAAAAAAAELFPVRIPAVPTSVTARMPALVYMLVVRGSSERLVLKFSNVEDTVDELALELANLKAITEVFAQLSLDARNLPSLRHSTLLDVGGGAMALALGPVFHPLSVFIGRKFGPGHLEHTVDKNLGAQQILGIVQELARFCRLLAVAGFVHGDISVNNVLVGSKEPDGGAWLKVIDYAGAGRTGSSRTALTATLIFSSRRILCAAAADGGEDGGLPAHDTMDDVESVFFLYLYLLCPSLPFFQVVDNARAIQRARDQQLFNTDADVGDYFRDQLSVKKASQLAHLVNITMLLRGGSASSDEVLSAFLAPS
jgi:hypothetical protein